MSRREDTENFLKVIEYDYPEWIPALFGLMPATWMKYGDDLETIILSHPTLFPDYEEGNFRRITLTRNYQKGMWVDDWGVTWDNIEEGMAAAPLEAHVPLDSWDAWDEYVAPDPLQNDLYGDSIDWDERRAWVAEQKSEGRLAKGKIYHGAMYMRLYYLRGFENLMMDIAVKDPRLDGLTQMVLHYNLKLIGKWIDIGADYFHFGDDLGVQKSLPISPSAWRRYLKPCFAQMFGKCRENGLLVSLHTDGYILDIIPDLIECGVSLVNPQVRPNTIEGLREQCQGKVALNLDLDRQLFPFASKRQLEDHIAEAIDTLALPEGGLMLHIEFDPDISLENIETICAALEKHGCRGINV